MPVEHCLLSCVAGWTQCRRSIQRSSSACGPRWDQCRDCPCCPGAAASQTCPIRREGWSTGKSRSGSCMWLEAKVHRNQFSYTMTPPPHLPSLHQRPQTFAITGILLSIARPLGLKPNVCCVVSSVSGLLSTTVILMT